MESSTRLQLVGDAAICIAVIFEHGTSIVIGVYGWTPT
jgi:hypothetical protein